MGKYKKSKGKDKPLRLRMPSYPITEDKLPLLIGEKISVERYNTFITRQEAPGYKFDLSPNGDVYIIDMASSEHEAIVSRVNTQFDIANGNNRDQIDCPIQILGQPLSHRPGGGGNIAPDLFIHPFEAFVQPPVHPGPPPGLTTTTPYARAICEFGVHESTAFWIAKCELWLREPYVRYVFGIKLHDKRETINAVGQYNRSMTARLWWQHGALPPPGAPPSGAPAPVAGVAPFSYIEWDFGTLRFGSQQTPTGCNAVGLPAFQVQIPMSEIFWDPPIGGIGGYVAAIPPVLAPPAVAPIAPIVNIDLYDIQRVVLMRQNN